MAIYDVKLTCTIRVNATSPTRGMIAATKIFDNHHVSSNECTTTWETANGKIAQRRGKKENGKFSNQNRHQPRP